MFVLDRFLDIEGHLRKIYIYNINLIFNIKLRSMLHDDLRLRDKYPPPLKKNVKELSIYMETHMNSNYNPYTRYPI